MSELYRNKYRSDTARALWWDYGRNGAYFITICTKDRKHFFGKIDSEKMELSATGEIAEKMWYEIPNHHEYVELGGFVVMPNHVHGIILLNKPVGTGHGDKPVVVGTGHALSLQDVGKNRFQHIGKNTISSIVGSYKSAVTKHANRLGLPNGWQSRFHDRIIRDADEYDRIAEYIIKNPEKWFIDKFYQD